MSDSGPLALVAGIEGIVGGVPDGLPTAEQMAIQSIIGQLAARVIASTAANAHTAIAQAVVQFSMSASGGVWRDGVIRLLRAWSRSIGRSMTSTQECSAVDIRVSRALRAIDARHAEPMLSLSDVALEVRTSAWHLARLLKRQTGEGFLGHLHRARVTAARKLLADSPLSVKEVAAVVGYRESAPFCRRFRQFCGCTPTAFRQMAARRRTLDRTG